MKGAMPTKVGVAFFTTFAHIIHHHFVTVVIAVENIHKSFGSLEILKGISFRVERSEIVSVIGPSGAGKTTLLQIIGTLMRTDSGSVRIDNTDLANLSEKKLSDFRNRKIGFIFQQHCLLPEFSALENVTLPALIAGESKKSAEERARRLLDFLHLNERIDHRPSQMSGGECQRVAVARALMNEPSVILADEPSGALDSKNKKELHELFLSLRDKMGQTFVIVTHDDHLASISDRVLEMRDGKIENTSTRMR